MRAVARLVPPGRVVAYGDIAALLGVGPRQVGRIMAAGPPGPPDPEEDLTAAGHAIDLPGDLPGEDRPSADDHSADDPSVDDPSADDPSVPWWRVTNAAGRLPAHLLDEALARWRQEGTGLSRGARGAAIRTHRADLPALADAAEAALGPLPGASGS